MRALRRDVEGRVVLHVRRRLPHCGARHVTPAESEDLTEVIDERGAEFIVLRSPDTAEHDPDYRELGRFATRKQALAFLEADGS